MLKKIIKKLFIILKIQPKPKTKRQNENANQENIDNSKIGLTNTTLGSA